MFSKKLSLQRIPFWIDWIMRSQAPARVCLFGEHQDYLNHPVIAAAVDLHLTIQAEPRKDELFHIQKPDIREEESFSSRGELLPYTKPRDYFRSGINVLIKEGARIDHGLDVVVHSRIPVAAGASSSSVLNVAWIRLLRRHYLPELPEDPVADAERAFQAEVVEFNEPGGRMDHYASSLGGAHFFDFHSHRHELLRTTLEGLILVDSLEKKETLGRIRLLKEGQTSALEMVKVLFPNRPLETIEEGELDLLPRELRPFGKAAVLNYALTLKGREVLRREHLDPSLLGALFREEQRICREYLKNSTPRINLLLDEALAAGALGGKVNGSGGGGTLFLYAPGKEERVLEALGSLPCQPFRVNLEPLSR